MENLVVKIRCHNCLFPRPEFLHKTRSPNTSSEFLWIIENFLGILEELLKIS